MKVALVEDSVVDEKFCRLLYLKKASHFPTCHVPMPTTVVDRCLRLVYQPAGLSSCSRRLMGMNAVFLDRVPPEHEILPFLTSACKATSKSQNFVLPQANLHLLLKSHAAMRHCKYIDHPRH